jgi:hypothetical protein
MAKFLSDDQIAAFERTGYVLLPALLSEADVHAMRAEAQARWTSLKPDAEADPAMQTWLQASLLPDIHHHSELIRHYYFRGPLVDVATQLIGADVKAATSQLTFKLRGNQKEFGWHQVI